ncbi:hypothetical protein WJ70_06265 [Burkholderia ubonensis]|uniref:hypothetical protein n=1 Tax=Burkholderia ubonensis TaxID=101571 RepID=UPI000759F570|nr:hypothetical protein [Burkholderia ubonensis]KVN99246.1 hypothetical protein WJ70_06265 [Burkholderia ubonensis]
MQLRRDETRLPLHERGIVLPDPQERLFILRFQLEDVHEDDRRCLLGELAVDRKRGIERAKLWHDRLHQFGCMMSIRHGTGIDH